MKVSFDASKCWEWRFCSSLSSLEVVLQTNDCSIELYRKTFIDLTIGCWVEEEFFSKVQCNDQLFGEMRAATFIAELL